MKYKALMLDVDGTLVPYDFAKVPSKKVVEAVGKARAKGVHVCLVTGRGYNSSLKILETLKIDGGYCVFNNGAVVMDVATKKPVYTRPIKKEDAERAIQAFGKQNVGFYLKKDMFEDAYGKGFFDPKNGFEECYMMFTESDLEYEQTEAVERELHDVSDVSVQRSHHKDEGRYGMSINHIEATKLHGIHVVEKKLGVVRKEIIGVGDSYNDFPLLMASGLKVAMGNAIDDLKEIADYVAPSVDDDGVCDVIEKFVLS